MPRIFKNTILSYTPNYFETEKIVNKKRIFDVNEQCVKKSCIIYLCEREVRVKDNFALQFALQKSNELCLPLKIIHPKFNYEYENKQKFINKQLQQVQKIFDNLNINFKIIDKTPYEIIKNTNTALLILDFNPILTRSYLNHIDCKVFEVDGHNIIPARFVSNKQEYNAATLRKKIYYGIFPFLKEFHNITDQKVEADFVLKDFIKNKLPYYSDLKNNPSLNILSGLSKYLNLGFISSQRVVLEVIKSNVDDINKEAFLEEIIVRKELADNFCFYANSFKDLSSIPSWAKVSINNHKYDIRPYIYSIDELEKAKTHDRLWNAAQIQLLKEGSIHGYLRMYWAKKIMEWVPSCEEALKIAIYLNDKYSFDAPSANGYVGILWAIGGLHDRAFADYPITGKIRRMTFNSLSKKYDLSDYIKKYTL